MTTRLRWIGGVAAAILGLVAVPASAEPALWAVRDSDSTIYLFGTAHAVRKDAGWKTPKIDAAMRASSALWLEIDDDLNASQAAMAAIVQHYGFDPARPLSQKLTPAQRARLAAVLAPYGMTPAKFEPMRPWLVAVTLGTLPFVKAGLDPAAGADRTLRSVGVAEKDEIHGFETAEQQIRFLADFSEAEQIAFLDSAMQDVAEGPAELAALSGAWEKGDVRTLAKMVITDMKREAPKLYDKLIVTRNVAWAGRIRTMLAGKGTAFVAVGVAHLVGPDSVQAQLAKSGIRSVRR
ncbi:TraB/GumN family protein [Sphingomonas montana]|uniref:TraB/GumN family protein n=1 Tax=Sphingomonas montana TaxID=1843236 RepID=UPI00096EFD98|nr:TraB/GumN family protein [Sphingomonas montana]